MPKEFIVAIELGSSKITGIAGKKNLDGSTSILAVVEEDATSCIRKGVIYNIDKTVLALSSIVKRLEKQLKNKISQVYVGVGGQSIRSIRNVIVKDLDEDTKISKDMIDELMDANRSMTYPEQEILDAVTQEYKVDSQYQIEPVGIQCRRLEGNFLNILWRKTFYRNLNKCFENANIPIAEMYLAPLAMADAVLTEAEKRSGCMLVDLGADTTTVSIYYKNILRHLAVIPLGSANITKDLESLVIEHDDAEAMKLKYASAYTDDSDIDPTNMMKVNSEREISSRDFIETVEGRMQEIVENAWYQVPNDYLDKINGGIVLTGGGANIRNVEKAFRHHTNIDKIRVANFVLPAINANQHEITARDGRMNTILALLIKGDMNCSGGELTSDLFEVGDEKDPVMQGTPHPTSGTGKVQTEAEKQQAEEEARRKKEEEERRIEEEERRQREAEEEERRKNSWFNKILRGIKAFGENMIKEEE
ncbi:MAG: cell division protein FtsA [Prevotella sp.]|nr:cell division protein FtsA [Prevotella sp.]MBQ6186634.1 cell division protein FtsA [Prevotella sp.]